MMAPVVAEGVGKQAGLRVPGMCFDYVVLYVCEV